MKHWGMMALILTTVAAALSGCAEKAILSEVLQQPEGQAIRTRYHLWYTEKGKLSSLNGMKGNFIPAGTVIEPLEIKRGTYNFLGQISVVDGKIRFKTESGDEYAMNYDAGLMMMPIEEFLRQAFTVESAETIYKDVPEKELDRVKAGKIEKGMHSSSVLVVLGPPAKSRTPAITNQSWLYWYDADSVFRIIYRGNVIRQIGSLE